jgi:hypothetical protein
MTVTSFVIRAPDGSVQRATIRVASPKRIGPGEWGCHVEVAPLLARTRISGGDALQALCLGLNFVGREMYTAERRGFRFLFETGERVPLNAYFRLRELESGLRAHARKAQPKGKRATKVRGVSSRFVRRPT